MIRIQSGAVVGTRPSAVLVDTDNTLYAYGQAHAAGLSAVLSRLSNDYKLDREVLEASFLKARQVVKTRLGNTASSHSRLLYFQELLEQVGLGTQVVATLDLEQLYWRRYLGASTLFPGVTDFLDELELAGVPTAIVTDLTAQVQFRKLIYFGIESRFSYVVTSEQSGFDKPDPSQFLLAIEKLGNPRGPVWMIGDDPERDALGARSAIGALTFLKVGSVRQFYAPTTADVVFTDFRSLSRLWKDVLRVD